LKDEEPMQRVHPLEEIICEIEYYPIGHRWEAINNRIEKICDYFVRPFDLSRAPLLRVGLINLKEKEYLLLLDLHHIIADDVSISILLDGFAAFYLGKELPALQFQYRDFSQSKNDLCRSGKIKKQEKYWLERFAEGIPTFDLPLDYPRPAGKSFEGEELTFDLPGELTDKIKEFARESQISIYIIFLAVFNILLSRYTAAEDIIVATPVLGRTDTDWQNTIGMFVNMVVMWNHPQPCNTFREFCQETKANALKAFENQDYPFDLLSRQLKVRSDTNRNPLTDIVLDYKNTDAQLEKIREMHACGLELESFPIKHNISKFDLLLNIYQSTQGINFKFTYCSKLFKKATIENMTYHFQNIIRGVVTNPAVKISDIEMRSQDGNEKLINSSEDKIEFPLYEGFSGNPRMKENLAADFDL
jgi:hypothetical protein